MNFLTGKVEISDSSIAIETQQSTSSARTQTSFPIKRLPFPRRNRQACRSIATTTLRETLTPSSITERTLEMLITTERALLSTETAKVPQVIRADTTSTRLLSLESVRAAQIRDTTGAPTTITRVTSLILCLTRTGRQISLETTLLPKLSTSLLEQTEVAVKHSLHRRDNLANVQSG